MREYLFRGKRVDNGEWVYGDFVRNSGKPCIYIDAICSYAPVLPETVGQFTGLTDSKGNKIFEGDIVKVKVTQLKDIAVYGDCCKIGVVVYDEDFGLYYLKANFMKFVNWAFNDEIEKLGTWFDNPELLRGKK